MACAIIGFMMTISNSNRSIVFSIAVLISLFIGMLFPRLMAYIPAILGVCFVFTIERPVKDIFPWKLMTILFAVLGLTSLSAFHSPDVEFSLQRVGKIAFILIPSLFFVAACRYKETVDLSQAIKYMLVIHLLIAALFFFERQNGHPITEMILDKDVGGFVLNRAYVVFALWSILFVFIACYHKYYKICAVIMISSAISLMASISQTAQLSFIVGALFFFFFPVRIKWMMRSVLAGIILFSLVFPFTIMPVKKMIPEKYLLEGIIHEASIIHRLEVWKHSAEKTFEKPVFGHGIEALRFLKSNEWMKHQKSDYILHSHNSALQIWVEFGAVGIFFACLFMIYIFLRIEKVDSLPARRLYYTMLVMITCISFTGYGLWQSWQIGLFIFFAGLSVMVTREERLRH